MREPPAHVTDEQVLDAVRTHWDVETDDVEHLPGDGGAHHWRARVHGRPALFVTLDPLGPRHDAATLEAAYAGAAALAFRIDFVVAGLPTHDLRYLVPLAGGALSCTPWVWGEQPADTRATAEATARMLARLHAVTPPPGLPRWEPPAAAREAALEQPWVVTHGAPHVGHQLATPVRTLLVGWGSLRLAPAERDLRWLLPDHPDLVAGPPPPLDG